MSSFNDYIKFSLDIEDQNIVFTDYFKKYIDGKYHTVYLGRLIQLSCPFCHSTNLKHNGHYTSNVRFITADDANKQMILTSQISSIDANATQTKQGNFFKVECEMAVSKDQAKKLRYGLEGKFVMVTGQKTYFSYYMEKFFNLG